MNPLYLDASRYALQLARWAAHYPREAILVVESEVMREAHAASMERIYRFLQVDPTVCPPEVVLNESVPALLSSPRSQRLHGRRSVRCLTAVTPSGVRTAVKGRIRAQEHGRALDATVTPEFFNRVGGKDADIAASELVIGGVFAGP